ncbi:MAG TPA: VWA domain-containing protein [Fibrobacteria bacterium]|nr:VWA domain-containing protein [Fibrobacteria bacterium]
MNLPHFQNPYFLIGLAAVPFLAWDYFRKNQRRKASIRFPSLAIVKRVPHSWAYRARHALLALRLLAISLMCIALARPQYGEAIEDVTTNGVDIMLALDISGSMRTMDFRPQNRLVVAKKVIENFVLGRSHDRIGLVIFSGKSFTQCPLTLDYGILVQFLRQVNFGMVEDGTAIGTALLNSTNRLRVSGAKSKVIILLTDGANNAGEVDPITAAKAAKALGIKIYAIGVGKEGEQPMEIDNPLFGKQIVSVKTDIDMPMLRSVANLTGGKWYRAQDAKALEAIYEDIDKLEKTEVKTTSYYRYHELFRNLLIIALLILLLETALANTRFMKIP